MLLSKRIYQKSYIFYIKDNSCENKVILDDEKGLFMSKLILEKYHNGSISFKDVIFNYNEVEYKGMEYIITLA